VLCKDLYNIFWHRTPTRHLHVVPKKNSVLNIVYVSEHISHRMGLSARWILSVHSVNASSSVFLLGISVIRSWDLKAMFVTLRNSLILSTLVLFHFWSWKINFLCTAGCPLHDAQIEKRPIAPAHHVIIVLICQQLRLDFLFLTWSYLLQIMHVRAAPGVHPGAAVHHSGFGSYKNCQCVRCGARILSPILCRAVHL